MRRNTGRLDTARVQQAWGRLSQLSVDDIALAPWWLRGLVLLGLMMFVLTFAWMIFIRPVTLDRQMMSAQTHDLVAQYAQKYAKAGQLTAIESQTESLEMALSGITEQLPNAFDMNSLIEQIHALALRTGVQVADIKTGAQSESTLFFERGMTLVFVGDYHKLGRLLAELSALPVPLTFHDFEMTKVAGQQAESRIRLTLQAKTYRAKSKKEQEQGGVHDSR